MSKIVVFIASDKDIKIADRIQNFVSAFEIEIELCKASAHKSTVEVLDIVEAYERDSNVVFIAVAGLSNALAGVIDANSSHPVITSPVLETDHSWIDVFSSLRMPSGVAPMVILNPENAALAALKILSQTSPELLKKVIEYKRNL